MAVETIPPGSNPVDPDEARRAKRRENDRRRRAANPEKFRARDRARWARRKAKAGDYRKSNAEHIRAWKRSPEQREKAAARMKRWRSKNETSWREYVRDYYAANKTTIRARVRQQRAVNPQPIREKENRYRLSRVNKHRELERFRHARKWAENINYKLRFAIRNRMKAVIKGKRTARSADFDFGCSIEQLIAHIQSQFQPGMSWGNWKKFGWHIDHIRPLASFDLTDLQQIRAACHYTNLRPLWWQDNLSKGSKIIDGEARATPS